MVERSGRREREQRAEREREENCQSVLLSQYSLYHKHSSSRCQPWWSVFHSSSAVSSLVRIIFLSIFPYPQVSQSTKAPQSEGDFLSLFSPINLHYTQVKE